MNVLFICTGNSCRSIIAEALFNHLAPKGFTAQSAGTEPSGRVNPNTLAVLKKNGLPTLGLSSKPCHYLPVKPDVTIVLSPYAAQALPYVDLGQALCVRWYMTDPSTAYETPRDAAAAYDEAYKTLQRRIGTFLKALADNPSLAGEDLKKALLEIALL